MPELADNATHEDITQFVDQIVEDRAGEDKGEEKGEAKGDAQKIAEDRDQPVGDMTADETSGSEDTADKGEDSGEESKGHDWLDDKLKAEVAAYGIDEKELGDFTSREELERALRLFDKNALEAGRKAMAEGRDEQGRFAKQEPDPKKDTTEGKQPDGQEPDGQYKINLDSDVYDEEIVGEFTRMRDYYDSRVAALEERFAQADAKAEEQRFDSLVDGLGHADLFGKSGKESAKELQRRKDLYVAAKAQQIGLEQLGRPADMDDMLVNRVARMVFADELGKKDWKNKTRKVAQQSNGRQGGGATRPSDPAETAREYAKRLYKELEDAG